MAVGIEAVYDTYTPNGTDDTLETLTVPAGQLWYVDGFYVAWDGSGPASNHEMHVGVGSTSYLDGLGTEYSVAARGNATGGGNGLDQRNDFAKSVGAYAFPGEEIRVGEDSDGGNNSDGNVTYTLGIRRVI